MTHSDQSNLLINHEINAPFKNYLLIKSTNVQTTRHGSLYIKATLADKSEEITSMIWDADDEKQSIFQSGNIIFADGVISEYNGSRQINLQSYSLINDSESIDINQLLKTAPLEPDVMYYEIIYEINNLNNSTIKHIVLDILADYETEFKMYPAAKNVHHAYVSGLAYHTYTMMQLAKSIITIYPHLNKDLLIASVVLHDVAKIKDYTGYIATDMTLQGKLKGHISTISEEIMQKAIDLNIQDKDEVLLLQHMVLSHHGKREWGSPVIPQIIEAFILHQIDKIDASMDAYKQSISKTKPLEFTDKIFGIDQTAFYNHNLNDKE